VTAGEYRTLLANRRDIPASTSEIIVASSADAADEAPADEIPGAATDATAIGGAPVAEATRLAADSKDRQRRGGKDKPSEVRLGSLDELVDYFIAAGKKGVAINRYKGLGEMNPDQLWPRGPAVRPCWQVHGSHRRI
jgi:DNA gyrase/topoisomerase IV subunit B